MSATLTMPRLGETMEEGRIVAWLVKPGEAFARGDPILEVETDKTVVEFPALGAGTLTETLVAETDTVTVGAPIARIDLGDGPDWTREDGERDTGASDPGAPQIAATPANPAPAGEALTAAPPPAAPEAGGGTRATPLARRIARQNGIDIAAVGGTGRRGRVERADVEAHAPHTQHASGALSFLHDIAHVAAGPEAGEPFLLIHGYAGDHTTFANLSSSLARAGRRAVAVDLPSHGATPIDAVTLDDLSPNLIAFTRSIFAGARPHVVASSMGAVPAVALAEALEPASLSLLCPVGLGLHIDGSFLDGMAQAESAGEIAHLLSRVTEGPPPITADGLAEVADGLVKGRLTALASALHNGGRQRVSLVAPIARLAERIPVRVLVGERDLILDARDATGISPRIAVHHFARVGHMPHWEAPAETLAILLGNR